MKVLTVQFCLAFCYFLPLRSKYSRGKSNFVARESCDQFSWARIIQLIRRVRHRDDSCFG